MGNQEIDWQGAWTLEDYVIDLFKKKLTDGEDFKVLIRIFGRERLVEIWDKYQMTLRISLQPKVPP